MLTPTAADPAGVKAVAKKGRRIAVTWKATKDLKGLSYQVFYKVAGKKARTVKASANSKNLKKLAAGKKVTVKVRGFKKIGGKAIYTKWSVSKTIRVKK